MDEQQSAPTTIDTPPTEAAAVPAEETVQQPPPQKRSVKKIILIVLGVLLLLFILALVGAYFYLQSQGLTPDKLSPQPDSPKTTIAPRTPTTNTYKNDNYKFSMPIEKDLAVKESPYGFGVTSVEMRYPDTTEEYGPDIQMLVFPKALGAAIGQDFGKTYDAPDNSTQEVKDPAGGSQSFTKVRTRTVNNLRAFEFRSNTTPEDPEVEAEIGVYIEMGTDILILTTGESNRPKLEEMLADFRYPL